MARYHAHFICFSNLILISFQHFIFKNAFSFQILIAYIYDYKFLRTSISFDAILLFYPNQLVIIKHRPHSPRSDDGVRVCSDHDNAKTRFWSCFSLFYCLWTYSWPQPTSGTKMFIQLHLIKFALLFDWVVIKFVINHWCNLLHQWLIW